MFRTGTSRGVWELQPSDMLKRSSPLGKRLLWPIIFASRGAGLGTDSSRVELTPLSGSPEFCEKDQEDLSTLTDHAIWFNSGEEIFAGAPVRSKPLRTYEPSRTISDPQGDNIPMYLADAFFEREKEWTDLKDRLEDFGKAAGLFDEIAIRPWGESSSEPFRVQVRKFGKRREGSWRNLTDVGYGVSQVLPVVIELLRETRVETFLLQQPEVHLHPSAQAALGSLFCQVVSAGCQLVVETHSDHLMDRIRLDVRDGISTLKPEDISILFFERKGQDVHIHSLRIDGEGNILGAPEGYRRFFMDETRRELRL